VTAVFETDTTSPADAARLVEDTLHAPSSPASTSRLKATLLALRTTAQFKHAT
jgi:hypothetical protein